MTEYNSHFYLSVPTCHIRAHTTYNEKLNDNYIGTYIEFKLTGSSQTICPVLLTLTYQLKRNVWLALIRDLTCQTHVMNIIHVEPGP